jgi:ribosomal-protein-alanine N-acetyltransferase
LALLGTLKVNASTGTVGRSSLKLPVIETERLSLKLAQDCDVDSIVAYVLDNRDFLKPWEPIRLPEFFTLGHWLKQIKTNQEEFVSDKSMRLFLFEKIDGNKVIGTANFTNFARGVAHYCNLGYSLAENKQSMGFMHEALSAAIPYVFDNLNMHRIMANYMPRNERSGRLLEKLGFVQEGTACNYLRIAGQWEDHILTSLTNNNWSESKS